MARLPRPVTKMISSTPAATASSTKYCTTGLSTIGNISFGCDFVAGRNRVPNPATGRMALRIFFITPFLDDQFILQFFFGENICAQERLKRSRIDPLPLHRVHIQLSKGKIALVNFRDFQFATLTRRGLFCKLNGATVKNIQSGDGIGTARSVWLLLNRDDLVFLIEFYDAESFRIRHMLCKNASAFVERLDRVRKVVLENIVSQCQCDGIIIQK